MNVRGTKGQRKFCFEAKIWKEIFGAAGEDVGGKIIYLRKVHRQQGKTSRDQEFKRILSEIRCGQLSQSAISFLSEIASEPLRQISSAPYVHLYANRKKVREKNSTEGQALLDRGEKAEIYTAVDSGEDPLLSFFLKSIKDRVPAELTLCSGIRVILTINLDPSRGLVNGRQGVMDGRPTRRNAHEDDFTWKDTVAVAEN